MKDFQSSGKRPGLRGTAIEADLSVLVGQLGQALPLGATQALVEPAQAFLDRLDRTRSVVDQLGAQIETDRPQPLGPVVVVEAVGDAPIARVVRVVVEAAVVEVTLV